MQYETGKQLRHRINAYRKESGLQPLEVHCDLERVAARALQDYRNGTITAPHTLACDIDDYWRDDVVAGFGGTLHVTDGDVDSGNTPFTHMRLQLFMQPSFLWMAVAREVCGSYCYYYVVLGQ
jgi:hypothetical protein